MSTKASFLKNFFKRYIVDALSHMAFGLFCSLILGLIIGQIARIPGLDFLNFIADALSAKSPLVGACIGLAIANGLSCAPLVVISSAVVCVAHGAHNHHANYFFMAFCIISSITI